MATITALKPILIPVMAVVMFLSSLVTPPAIQNRKELVDTLLKNRGHVAIYDNGSWVAFEYEGVDFTQHPQYQTNWRIVDHPFGFERREDVEKHLDDMQAIMRRIWHRKRDWAERGVVWEGEW